LIPDHAAYVFAGSDTVDIKLPIVASSDPPQNPIMKVTQAKVHLKFRTQSEYDYDVALALLGDDIGFGGKT
jgi:hypothetical protein